MGVIIGSSASELDKIHRIAVKKAGLSKRATPGPHIGQSSPAKDLFLPRPEVALEAAAQAAVVNGAWQTDGSRHAVSASASKHLSTTLLAEPKQGRATLRVAYLFSGVKRKASIAEYLQKLCVEEGIGLIVDEIDILIGGKEHDLLDRSSQDALMARIESGDYDVIILSPPCGTWSRANYSGLPGPKPVRGRSHPWGFPNIRPTDRRRADKGNEFIHFSIRSISATQNCKRRGRRVMTVLEHPEDLGRARLGVPASIRQLKELRSAFSEFPFVTVAGYQCQFPGVDRQKPTRLLSDILSLEEFGWKGWPVFDAADNYIGPLPQSCGHTHEQQMIGTLPGGGFATSPTAAYPPGMCKFLAWHIFNDFMHNGRGKSVSACGGGYSPTGNRDISQEELLNSSRSPHTPFPPPATSELEEDLFRGSEGHPREEVARATRDMERKGSDGPIAEEIDIDIEKDSDEEVRTQTMGTVEDENTSEEEEQLGRRRRPKKGEGWWGRGPALRTTKKGIARDFADSAGYPSPGRWPPSRRRLPDDEVANQLWQAITEGLMEASLAADDESLREMYQRQAAGKYEASPFPEDNIRRTRRSLRSILRKAGFKVVSPMENDIPQVTEVRLIQNCWRRSGIRTTTSAPGGRRACC